MGVQVKLKDQNGETLLVERHTEGGQCAIGGSCEADLYITYNYSARYREVIPDYPGLIELFNDKKASDLLPVLEDAVEKLGTEQSDDYWAATPGNAGRALSVLISWMKQYPDATMRASG